MPLSHGASDQTLPGLKPLLFLSGSLLGVVVVVVVVSLCSLPPLSLSPSPLQKWRYYVVMVCFMMDSCNVGTYSSQIGFEFGPLKIKTFGKTYSTYAPYSKAGKKKN